MNFKEIEAPNTTKTFNRNIIDEETNNIYKAVAIIARRAEQINQEMKTELTQKLDEFASHNDSLEEVFENREQIEVSKFYEGLPKPTSIAIQEWIDGGTYYRFPEENPEEK